MFPLVGSGRFITSPVITDDGQPIPDPLVMPETNTANGSTVLPQDDNRLSSMDSANNLENVTDKKLIQWMLTLHQIGVNFVLCSVIFLKFSVNSFLYIYVTHFRS